MSNRQTCCVIISADIDECERGLDDCYKYATCINTIGSYECICNVGFTGDGRDCIGENMATYTVPFGSVTVLAVCLLYSRNTGCA